MHIPRSAIGTSSPPTTMTVERGRLQLFAKATNQADPVYIDPAIARAHGHPDLPVPPTFLFGVQMETPDPFEWITSLGVDLNTVLHGTQTFTYNRMAYAGDVLTAHSTITNISAKKEGALEIVDRATYITRDGTPIARLDQTVLVRNVPKEDG